MVSSIREVLGDSTHPGIRITLIISIQIQILAQINTSLIHNIRGKSDSEKLIENEVSRKESVAQWKSNQDRGWI